MNKIDPTHNALVPMPVEDPEVRDRDYRAYVRAKIASGLKRLEQEGGLTREDARKRMAKWRVD